MRYVALALLIGCHGADNGVEVDASPAANCVWSPPVELTEFADTTVERDPTETADKLELYYTGEIGEILFASRTTVDQPFVRRPLPAFDDPLANDASPVVSADGLHIVFTSDRSGSLQIYEATRASRTAPWSAPVQALGGGMWQVDPGGIGMTTDASNVVFPVDNTFHCFTRRATDGAFMPNSDELFVMPSPAFDDAFSTIYYNCGNGICARPLTAWPNFKVPGKEQPVAMGTPSGAADPWIEPGGDTILFAAEHSLFRSTRVCN